MGSWKTRHHVLLLLKNHLVQASSAASVRTLGGGVCRYEGLEVVELTPSLAVMELVEAVPRLPRPALLPAVLCWLATHSKRYVR